MNLQEDILMLSGCDMIVGLTDLPEYELGEGLKLSMRLREIPAGSCSLSGITLMKAGCMKHSMR